MSKNIYHRYVNLPFEVNKPDCFTKVPEHWGTYITKEHLHAHLIKWLEERDITISNIVEMFYTAPSGGKAVPMHTDTPFTPETFNAVKLNFTWGPSNSYLQWWKLKPGKTAQRIDLTNTINKQFIELGIEPDIPCDAAYTANPDDVDLVYEAVIDRPSLCNVGHIHSTRNENKTEERWTMSYTLLNKATKELLSFEEAEKILEEVIV